jgi:hypothetical protein
MPAVCGTRRDVFPDVMNVMNFDEWAMPHRCPDCNAAVGGIFQMRRRECLCSRLRAKDLTAYWEPVAACDRPLRLAASDDGFEPDLSPIARTGAISRFIDALIPVENVPAA